MGKKRGKTYKPVSKTKVDKPPKKNGAPKTPKVGKRQQAVLEAAKHMAGIK